MKFRKPAQIAGNEITHRKFAQNEDGTDLGSLKCGVNYSAIIDDQAQAVTAVSQGSEKNIGHSNIKCYNIFDWRNAVDLDNKDIPNYHTSSNGPDDAEPFTKSIIFSTCRW